MGGLPWIERLPENVRRELHGWLRDPGISQKEARERTNALLEELGSPQRVSRSSLSRYDLQMRFAGENLSQSREVAEAWIAKIGSAPDGKLGHLVIEMLRSVAFDLTLRLQQGDLDDESLAGLVQTATSISLMAQRLEQSSDLIDRRERRIKREAAEELAAKAARESKADRAISPERLREIIREAYGL